VTGLPEGVTVPAELVVPAGKVALSIELTAADNIAAGTAQIGLAGEATPGAVDAEAARVASEKALAKAEAAAKVAAAKAAAAKAKNPNLPDPPTTPLPEVAALKAATEAAAGLTSIRRSFGPTLLATTIKPPFAIDAEGKDDVTKWPRGTTFPAPVLIERDPGFNGEILLEMTSQQGRHRMGIRGPDMTVAPGLARVLYPVFLPEWLETTRTSRMVVNGVAQVADPKGNIRYSVAKQKTRMGFLPTGAMLKLSADETELLTQPGQSFAVPLTLSRSARLTQPVQIELTGDLHAQPAAAGKQLPFTAQRITKPAMDNTNIRFAIDTSGSAAPGEYELTIRAHTLHDGLPVVSETHVVVRVTLTSAAQNQR
jgi:hypothetical protein